MKRYLIHVPVSRVDGTQTFAVEAENEAEALAKFREGDGTFIQENLDVVGLDTRNAEVEEDTPC